MGAIRSRYLGGGGGRDADDPATAELRKSQSTLNVDIRRMQIDAREIEKNIIERQRRVDSLYQQQPAADEVTRREAVRNHVMAKRRLRQVNSTISKLQRQRDSYGDLATTIRLQTTMTNVMTNLKQNAPSMFSGPEAIREMAKSGAEIADFQDRMELGMEFVISNADHDDAELDEEVDRVEAAFRDAHELASMVPVPETSVRRAVRRGGDDKVVSIAEEQDDKKHE